MRIECCGAFRKSGSPNVMCSGSGGDELLDVGEDRGLVGDPHPAVVDDRHRAVPAAVRAPSARFDGTDEAASRHRPRAARSDRAAGRRSRAGAPADASLGSCRSQLHRNADGFALDPRHQGVFVLARDHRVGDVGAHRGVQPVAAHRFRDRGRRARVRAGLRCASAPRTRPGPPSRPTRAPTGRSTCRAPAPRAHAHADARPGPARLPGCWPSS